MAKNNIRSIRFSDELADLIDRQAGDTFTQKFENLVTRCVWEVPAAEKRLEQVREEIKRERQRLYDLQKATEQLRMLERDKSLISQSPSCGLIRKSHPSQC